MKTMLLTLVIFVSNLTFGQDETIGLRLSEIRKGSIYQRLGMKNGDIITTINGKGPASLEMLTTALSEKKAGDTMSVVIERNGKTKNLHYNIK